MLCGFATGGFVWSGRTERASRTMSDDMGMMRSYYFARRVSVLQHANDCADREKLRIDHENFLSPHHFVRSTCFLVVLYFMAEHRLAGW